MKRFFCFFAIVVILGLANNVQASTIILANEDFENPSDGQLASGITDGGFDVSGDVIVGEGFSSLGGGIYDDAVAFRDTSYSAPYKTALTTFSKEVGTAVPGTMYTLEMDASAYSSTTTFSVTLDVGGTPYSVSQVHTQSTDWNSPIQLVLDYTAVAADAGKTLTAVFAGDDSLSRGFYIMDNLSVQATAAEVPEPSTFALLATGLVGLLGYASRKRK